VGLATGTPAGAVGGERRNARRAGRRVPARQRGYSPRIRTSPWWKRSPGRPRWRWNGLAPRTSGKCSRCSATGTDRAGPARRGHPRLFAAGMQLQARVTRQIGPISGPDRRGCRRSDTTIRDIRSAIFRLRAPTESTLRGDSGPARSAGDCWLPAASHRARAIDSAVPDAVRPALLAVLREALSNVSERTGQGREGGGVGPGRLLGLVVTDDGTGAGAWSPRRGCTTCGTGRGIGDVQS